ncbi:MAG: SGNH/GDSL hydrolase family protein, partial [Ignavibacteriaceae bacterium]|nr:SGNH/GDSL hydrolase family protein [Ignavibacteriaceae bacterium]
MLDYFLSKIGKTTFLLTLISISVIAQTGSNLTLLSPNGGEYWTTGSSPRFTWIGSNILIIKIEISYDAGANWTVISPAAIATSGSFNKWVIPSQIQSDSCLVRITKYDDQAVSDMSENYFSITTDTTTHTLVVLGSSTAAGVGPSSYDSAWVWRYRNYLFERNTTFKVINLAVGGYTTYDIMPTGFIPPANRPTPKITNNISKAVTYNPDALIINLPSNDVSMGYSISEQLSNYDTILTAAHNYNIPVWVTTTQPRNFSSAQILKQIEMRDSTFSRFGEKAIDFWTTIADAVGRIDPLYDAGDGIHLNDKAHAILFNRVVEKNILNPTIVSVKEKHLVLKQFELLQNYPNP